LLQLAQRFLAQTLVHAALNDAEQGVAAAFVRQSAALRPTQAQTHRIGRLPFVCRIRRALVEDHSDVGVEHALDAHCFLG